MNVPKTAVDGRRIALVPLWSPGFGMREAMDARAAATSIGPAALAAGQNHRVQGQPVKNTTAAGVQREVWNDIRFDMAAADGLRGEGGDMATLPYRRHP